MSHLQSPTPPPVSSKLVHILVRVLDITPIILSFIILYYAFKSHSSNWAEITLAIAALIISIGSLAPVGSIWDHITRICAKILVNALLVVLLIFFMNKSRPGTHSGPAPGKSDTLRSGLCTAINEVIEQRSKRLLDQLFAQWPLTENTEAFQQLDRSRLDMGTLKLLLSGITEGQDPQVHLKKIVNIETDDKTKKITSIQFIND